MKIRQCARELRQRLNDGNHICALGLQVEPKLCLPTRCKSSTNLNVVEMFKSGNGKEKNVGSGSMINVMLYQHVGVPIRRDIDDAVNLSIW
jgi:hypothetical protein